MITIYVFILTEKMSSVSSFNDADLKSKLAQYGIVSPITNTTRNVLIKKLQKLEKDTMNRHTNQSTQSCSNIGVEFMVI